MTQALSMSRYFEKNMFSTKSNNIALYAELAYSKSDAGNKENSLIVKMNVGRVIILTSSMYC